MTSCSQLEDIEALVIEELDAARSAELRAHAVGCRACRDELALVNAERALFARRAEVMAPALAALAVPAPAFAEREASTSHPRVARVVPAMARLLRRGHVSAACAAALFVVAGFSRLGNPAAAGTASSLAADDEGNASGMLASIGAGDEPLACSSGSGLQLSRDDGLMVSSSSVASASPSSSQGLLGEVLACGARERAGATASCEPSVTCSWFRQ